MRYKIGAFHQLTGVPQATLRYYDKEGLLCPRRAEGNSYRYYDEENLFQLVQLRQFNGFGMPLSSLPAAGSAASCPELLEMLTQRRREVEDSIEELHRLLSRIRLHEHSFKAVCDGNTGVIRQNMVGAYRLMLSDPEVQAHPDAREITRRWLSYTPYTYSVLRIRLSDLQSMREGAYPVQLGLGLLKGNFDELGERFAPPMQYSPVTACVQGLVETPDLRGITPEHMAPFFDFMSKTGLVPYDDAFGWVMYVPGGEPEPRFRISMRIAVG